MSIAHVKLVTDPLSTSRNFVAAHSDSDPVTNWVRPSRTSC